MNINYFNNIIDLSELNIDEKNVINDLWEIIREDYTDWVADVRIKTIDGNKSLVDLLEWRGMSTWWLNRLTQKNSFTSNQWLNRIMLMYFAKQYDEKLNIFTDDIILARSIKRNGFKTKIHKNNQTAYSKLFLNYTNNLLRLFASILREIEKIILFKSVDNLSNILPEDSKKIIWFRSLYPAAWVKIENKKLHDRLYESSPFLDQVYGFESRYLLYLSKLKKDNNYGFFKLRKKIKNLEVVLSRKIAFPESKIKISDIFSSYFSTLKEQLRFHRFKRTKSFRGLFQFNNLDLSNILFDEWSKSYWGDQQYAKLQGLVTTNYFEELNQNQIVITYGELHMQNRATYFLTKSIKPLIKFISIQHATSFKNKMFTYYRKSEFNFKIENDGIKYMPRPDFYLVQGDQYKKVLSEFFDETLISVIGSLKNILPENFQKFDKKNNSSLNQFNKNKKNILIAPSITDYKVLIEAFKSWKYDANYSILLSPHPASDIEKISQYIKKIMPNQKINLVTNLRTYELLPLCDLVVTGYSTIAIEAAAFKVPSVRFTVPGEMSQFEYDNRIPSFKAPDEFLKWLKGFQSGKYKLNNIDYEKIISDYFYKNDGNAQKRLWEFLKNNF